VNSIGRLATNNISLNYNDTGISRENHAEIIYDSMNRKFYAGRTGGRNLTYVNGSPVLQSVELKSGDKLQLGSTVLRFVAFCGEDFNWEDPEETGVEEPKKA
jgi:pSer/pThr/pTyr-binding forkhead associated (FHA) protein